MESKFVEIGKFFLINVNEILRTEPIYTDENSFRIVLKGDEIITCNDPSKYTAIKEMVTWL